MSTEGDWTRAVGYRTVASRALQTDTVACFAAHYMHAPWEGLSQSALHCCSSVSTGLQSASDDGKEQICKLGCDPMGLPWCVMRIRS